jgi:dethiobiotin synthetase
MAARIDMSHGVFVAGTDTGVGKTEVSCALLRALNRAGIRALGMKPVASGCNRHGDCWRNDDALALAAAGAEPSLEYARVNPFALPEPLAPEIAARHAGIEITLTPILGAHAALAARADAIVVEGVGGWSVPFSPALMQADLVRALGLPVLLVVGLRLGCLNHALLSARAIAADGCELLGWIGNGIDPEMGAVSDNVASLTQRLAAPCLAVIAHRALPSLPARPLAIDALLAHWSAP